MRAAGIVAAFVTLVTLTPATAAHAGNAGFLVPPTKLDFGYLTFRAGDRVYGGGQWMVGLNWATIYPRKTWLDIGAGYVGAVFGNPLADERMIATPKGSLVTED